MSTAILSGVAFGVLLLSAVQKAGGGEPPPAPSAAEAPAAAKLPSSPAELFAALSKGIRPQWRTYFRGTVPHSAGDRYKGALALGAVCADCYLAADVRDAQQVRNLLQDMASLEKMLSITRQMGGLRQNLTALAEAGDWPAVRAAITSMMASHAQFLGQQKDEALAELEHIGCWLRAFQVGAKFSASRPQPPAQPCIWSSALLADLHGRAAKLSARVESKTLQSLLRGLEALNKTWAGETTAANAAARLAVTVPLLDAMVAELINDEPAAPPQETKPPR